MFSDEIPNTNNTSTNNIQLNDSNSEMFDNDEGYYICRVGELFYNRYRVLGEFGKGVFSTVLKCEDTLNNNFNVAIKVIRSNEIMTKEGIYLYIIFLFPFSSFSFYFSFSFFFFQLFLFFFIFFLYYYYYLYFCFSFVLSISLLLFLFHHHHIIFIIVYNYHCCIYLSFSFSLFFSTFSSFFFSIIFISLLYL